MWNKDFNLEGERIKVSTSSHSMRNSENNECIWLLYDEKYKDKSVGLLIARVVLLRRENYIGNKTG